MNYNDKNIIVIRNGKLNKISVNGTIAKYFGQEILFSRSEKIINNKTHSKMEIIKIGKKELTYNCLNGYWVLRVK